MFSFIIDLIICLGALTGLALIAPSIIYSWRVVPFYYNLARVALPLMTLAYFGPNLFGLNFPGRSGWPAWVFLGGLGLIVTAILVFLYREPGESYRRRQKVATYEIAASPLSTAEGIIVRSARSSDLAGAGRVFAEAFHHSFDLDFGPDRARNGCLLSELLGIKQAEVEVAVLAETGQVIGAMWLDLGDKSVPQVTFGKSWSILKRYLNGLHAFYFAIFALPTMMAQRSTAQQGYIQWLGIDPVWQGRRVGRLLVERATELSQAAGKRELVLHTERSNDRARKLYTHTGFEDRSGFAFTPRVRFVKLLGDG